MTQFHESLAVRKRPHPSLRRTVAVAFLAGSLGFFAHSASSRQGEKEKPPAARPAPYLLPFQGRLLNAKGDVLMQIAGITRPERFRQVILDAREARIRNDHSLEVIRSRG